MNVLLKPSEFVKARKLPEGSIREWVGKKYKKVAGKWKRVASGKAGGDRQQVARRIIETTRKKLAKNKKYRADIRSGLAEEYGSDVMNWSVADMVEGLYPGGKVPDDEINERMGLQKSCSGSKIRSKGKGRMGKSDDDEDEENEREKEYEKEVAADKRKGDKAPPLLKGRKLPEGTVRDWKGKKYKKVAGKWVPHREGGKKKAVFSEKALLSGVKKLLGEKDYGDVTDAVKEGFKIPSHDKLYKDAMTGEQDLMSDEGESGDKLLKLAIAKETKKIGRELKDPKAEKFFGVSRDEFEAMSSKAKEEFIEPWAEEMLEGMSPTQLVNLYHGGRIPEELVALQLVADAQNYIYENVTKFQVSGDTGVDADIGTTGVRGTLDAYYEDEDGEVNPDRYIERIAAAIEDEPHKHKKVQKIIDAYYADEDGEMNADEYMEKIEAITD